MEEVDNIILNSLRECGCDFAEEVSSLAELSTENVVEATVKCLRVINPDTRMSHSLPPGMSARFRIGTALAQACQSAGYRGDVGYQTFLYSSEADIRRLFMFLVEKMPRKKDESVESQSGKVSALQRNIARVLKEKLSSVWLPPYCKKDGLRWCDGDFHIEGARSNTQYISDPIVLPEHVGDTHKDIGKDLLDYYEKKLPFVVEQLSSPQNLNPSLLEWNALELSLQLEWENQINSTQMSGQSVLKERRKKRMENLRRSLRENHIGNNKKKHDIKIGGISINSSFAEITSLLSSQPSNTDFATSESNLEDSQLLSNKDRGKQITVSRKKPAGKKPPIPKKPAILENHVTAPSEDGETKTVAGETEEQRMERIEKELNHELTDIIEKLQSMETEVHNFQESITEAHRELSSYEESNKTVQEKVKLQNKTLKLLPNAEENIEKLEVMIDNNQKRMETLTQQWDKHRVPLIEKLEDLKDKSSKRQTLSERKLEEMKQVRQRIKESTEEIKRKEVLEKQLAAEYGEMSRDVSRKSYTKKIFEIVSNIRKQKEQIESTLRDVRTLQKEINQLQGRVERTLTAADEIIFVNAKQDDSVRQTYKYLVSLSSNCSQLLDTVEDTGGVMREIRDLENQIATESERNTTVNLKKITSDFKAMKKENSEMMKKLKSVKSKP